MGLLFFLSFIILVNNILRHQNLLTSVLEGNNQFAYFQVGHQFRDFVGRIVPRPRFGLERLNGAGGLESDDLLVFFQQD